MPPTTAARRTRPARPALGLLREPGRRPQGEERVDGQEVPRELHLERARQEDVGHEERREHPLDVRELPDVEEAAARGPERGGAEERAEAPEHDLPRLVEEVRDADVLVRVGHDPRVADHRPLFRRASARTRGSRGARTVRREGTRRPRRRRRPRGARERVPRRASPGTRRRRRRRGAGRGARRSPSSRPRNP